MSTKNPCPTTGKHSYPHYAEAVRYAIRSSRTFAKPIRIYQCPDCHAHHLTSQVVRICA